MRYTLTGSPAIEQKQSPPSSSNTEVPAVQVVLGPHLQKAGSVLPTTAALLRAPGTLPGCVMSIPNT